MDIKDIFKELGYDITARQNFIQYIHEWQSWYKGKVEHFHNYKIYNGVQKINRERYSLQLAKYLSEKMADFLFNEKVKINLGEEKSNDILNEILEDNDFNLLMNRGIEKAFSMGTGCVVFDIDNITISDKGNILDYNKSKIKLNYINAENIFPLTWDDRGIHEIGIVEYKAIGDGNKLCILKLHTKNQKGNYIITSYRFFVDKNNNYTEDNTVAEPYIKVFDTKSDLPWFFIITPNIENNIDIYSPFGISIFANALDVLKGIDITYDSFVNEIQLGRKRLFASKDILRFDSTTGQQEFVFDPEDIVFHILGEPMSGGDKEAGKYIQEINGKLRVEEHISELDMHFKLLGAKTGFGSAYLTFDETSMAPKTATEVISENSELYNMIRKHTQLLEARIRGMIYTIEHIGHLTGKFDLNTEDIFIDFDDSILQSKKDERNEDRQDLAQDTLSRIDYYAKWRNVDEETAREKIAEIDNEKPANERISFFSGEVD